MLYVETITEKLSQKDPENQGFYKKNAEEYLQKLKALHEESLQRIAKIPDKQKRIVTSEGSFKYFSKAYQIPSSYIWEINTEEEGTPEQLKTLIDQLRESEVPALFLESSMNPKPMQSVSNETGIPIYSQIFTDSLSEPGTKGDSYYAMMQWNIDQIVQGLSQK